MYRFTYTRLHIPTNKRWEASQSFQGVQDFLDHLNRWNRQQPGVWQYYANVTVGVWE